MRNYITLDGKKYKTQSADWADGQVNPRTVTRLLSGAGDATFSAAQYNAWKGTIICPNTAEGTGWGTMPDFLASSQKKSTLAFEDHRGVAFTITLGPTLDRRSLLPDWESAYNEFYINTEIFSL